MAYPMAFTPLQCNLEYDLLLCRVYLALFIVIVSERVASNETLLFEAFAVVCFQASVRCLWYDVLYPASVLVLMGWATMYLYASIAL